MLIYKITNSINNKIYIGQTKFSLSKRWKEHIHAYKYGIKYNKYIKNNAIYQAMRKYDIKNFQIEIIEYCKSIKELNKKEQYWIKKYNSLSPNGYNLTTGGKRPKFSQETRKKLSEASKKNAKITEQLLKYFKIGHKLNQKILYRKNLNTNEIKIYNSLYEAGLDGFNRKNLSRAINQRTGFYKGYYWYYENQKPREKIPNPQIKKVYMYDLNLNLLKIYNTLSETKKDNFNIACVSMCCNNKLKKHKNRIFSFSEI